MRLSVALCTYNGAKYLQAQLDSLRAQIRLPDELVVCDDRSTDGTLEILQAFASASPFPVRIHVNPVNLGSTKNFEQAVAQCSGDAIFLCDQDDVWCPEKLARFEAVLAADPTTGLVASDLELIDAAGGRLNRRVWAELPFNALMRVKTESDGGPRLWLRANTITGAAMAFRASLREVVLPIPPCWVHDAWIAFLVGALSPVRLITDPLTEYRSHSGQQIGSEPLTLRRQIRAARRMDAAYFARVVECFTAAADRLSAFSSRVRDPDLIGLTRAKAEFARAQYQMRMGGRVGRLGPAVRELVRGNYARFGRGLKGFAADLLL